MYIVKPEYRNYAYVPQYRPLSECEVKMLPYRKVVDGIVQVIGDKGKEFYDQTDSGL